MGATGIADSLIHPKEGLWTDGGSTGSWALLPPRSFSFPFSFCGLR
jgi:hypothetical protein